MEAERALVQEGDRHSGGGPNAEPAETPIDHVGSNRIEDVALEVAASAVAQDLSAIRTAGALLWLYSTRRAEDEAFGKALLGHAAAAGDAIAAQLVAEPPGPAAVDLSGLDEALMRALGEMSKRRLSKEKLADRPVLYLSRGFFHLRECAYLMAMASLRLEQSRVKRFIDPEGAVKQSRTSLDAKFTRFQLDPVAQIVSNRISRFCEADPDCTEIMDIVHYGPGGQFAPHFDSTPSLYRFEAEGPAFLEAQQGAASPPVSARGFDRFGPRTISFIGYLNDAYAGGATVFPRARLKVAGGRGDAIYFCNELADGKLDPMSFHGGAVVESGEKWICVQWFRKRKTHAR